MADSPVLARHPRARWLLPLFLVALVALTWHRLSTRPATEAAPALSGRTMGTTWSLRLARMPAGETVDALERLVQARLDAVDAAMSTYRDDSELVRFNRHASDAPVPASEAMLEVFRIAAAVSERSGGALDVTVAPLVALWGFGAGAGDASAPTGAELAAARDRIGWRRIVVDNPPGTLRKTRPDAVCDLSAVAKGYGVDRVAAALSERGIDDFLIDVGGDVRARGRRPDGTPWRLGIEQPDAPPGAVHAVVALRDAALATSGDYRNFHVEAGVRRSHLIDPRSGRPIEHGLASVSVIHDTAALADAWATALSVLGPAEGAEVARAEGLAVHFVVRGADGSFTSSSTPAFAARLLFEEP